jgi:hypothetical protein
VAGVAADQTIIQIHAAAPTKPELGQACNGCGVCCLAEPCPVGILISRRRHGACKALLWSEHLARYQCGMLSAPLQILGWHAKGRGRQLLARLLSRWSARLISAGTGCDATLRVERLDAARR